MKECGIELNGDITDRGIHYIIFYYWYNYKNYC
jgi:hypothetical protein